MHFLLYIPVVVSTGGFMVEIWGDGVDWDVTGGTWVETCGTWVVGLGVVDNGFMVAKINRRIIYCSSC